jgi:hypothetical protein
MLLCDRDSKALKNPLYKLQMSPQTTSKGNITYVSMLIRDERDRIPIEQRLQWLHPLFESGVPLHLFVDEAVWDLLRETAAISSRIHPGITLHRWSFVNSDTWTLCHLHSPKEPLRLPAVRNAAKDTEFFMALMHAKAELVAAVADLPEVTTPFVAFIDAGIHKIFQDPVASWTSLASLSIRPEMDGLLLPGCWEPRTFPKEELVDQINWTFCGGFFIVPRIAAHTFWEWQVEGMKDFLRDGCITWEVNTWVHCRRDASLKIYWFAADHNDRMAAVPTQWLLKAVEN